MKLTNMIIKFLNALSALVKISASLYCMIRAFAISVTKEIKEHFLKAKNK